jgi:outer membrane scaffolding protein for murein synthesis (MipA/OmpV family)
VVERARCASLLLLVLIASSAVAREEPLWEAGIGVAAIELPGYRGSDRSRAYVLPAPYFVYRGDILKADGSGLRGVFMRTDTLDLHLSLGASLPVESDDVPARAGMPDLAPSVEAGPSLDVTLWRSAAQRVKLDLRLPLRGAMTIERSPRYIGAQFFPHLNLDIHDPAGLSGWNLGLLAGPVYTDGRYNRYFYEVAPAFATATRPAYTTGGGYGGTQFIAALSKRFPTFWIGGFVRYDTLHGAVFEGSPLVTSKRYVAGGFAVTWILGESSQRVPVTAYGDELR